MRSMPIIRAKLIEVPHLFGMKDLGFEDLNHLGLSPRNLIWLKQVHGTEVLVLKGNEKLPPFPLPFDAVITDQKDVILLIRTADCIPIFLWDPHNQIIGAIHAGWRGVLRGIIPKAINEMVRAFPTKPQNLIVALGPSIKGCCYEFKGKELEEFLKRFGPQVITQKDGVPHLDLPLCALKELERCGVQKIEEIPNCTFCDPRFHSWRRQRERKRNYNFITLSPPPSFLTLKTSINPRRKF